MKNAPQKKLNFHPIGELFTSPGLTAEFLPTTKYKQIAKAVQEAAEEAALATDIKAKGPLDAKARARAAVVGNDSWCEKNDAPFSIIELAAEMVLKTTARLAFVRLQSGVLVYDLAFAFKAPKLFADINQEEASFHLQHLQVFAKIEHGIEDSNPKNRLDNKDIEKMCLDAISACLFLLKQISEARFSAIRSNTILSLIKNNPKVVG